MNSNLTTRPESTLETYAHAAKVSKSAYNVQSLRDVCRTPIFFDTHRIFFQPSALGQLIAPGLSVDGLWGGLEEVNLKLKIRGDMCSEDWKKKRHYEELLCECGLSYVPVRPEWDLEHFGVLQLVDPDALVEKFPSLSAWEPDQYLFSLFRLRMHGA